MSTDKLATSHVLSNMGRALHQSNSVTVLSHTTCTCSDVIFNAIFGSDIGMRVKCASYGVMIVGECFLR